MSLSEAIEVVGKMLQGYPNGRDVPNSYIGALASVVAQYPRCVTHRAGDAMHGVPRETRFLPTPADVIAWCEREVADLRGIVERDDHESRVIHEMRERRESGEKADEARKARPTLADLKAKYGPNWGIGQSDNEADQVARAVSAERMRQANEALLLREYAAAGVAPITAAPGIAVSLELARQLRERPAPQREAAE